MITEKPIDVDDLFHSRPELFPHPLRSLEMRQTVFVGEKVKILTGIREREQLVAGRWLVVESICHTESGLQCFGRSDWDVDKGMSKRNPGVHRIGKRCRRSTLSRVSIIEFQLAPI